MNSRQRFKLSAGAGLVTMLLGALMVVAPGAGAEDGAGRLVQKVTICHRTNAITNPYREITVSFTSTDAGATWSSPGDHVGNHGTGGVFDPRVHTANSDDWSDIVPDFDRDGPFLGLHADVGATYLANGCQAPDEGADAPVLVVEKVVPEIEDTTPFGFNVSGGSPTTGSAMDGRSFSATLSPGNVQVTENVTAGYTLTDLDCSREHVAVIEGEDVVLEDQPVPGFSEISGSDRISGGASFTAADGDIITCTFTNTRQTATPSGGISVKKALAGNDQASAANTPFRFTVDCTNGQTVVDLDPDSAATQAKFTLKASDVAKSFSGLPVGATCTVVEDVTGNADSTAITVDAVASSNNATVSGVTINDGVTRAVVVTNTFNTDIVIVPNPDPVIPPEPASLRIVKAVDAVEGGVVPSAWTVDFDVVGDGLDVSRTLDQGNTSDRFRDLDAGAFTITETTPTGDTSSLTEVECVEAGGGDVDMTEVLSDKSATVILDEGDAVTCTFTNTYPEVLSEGETPTEPPAQEPTPAVTPDVEVKGVQTVRALPRTGDETGGLAGMGALMLAVGAAMVLGSKRQLARR